MNKPVRESAPAPNLRDFYRHFDNAALRDALRRMYLIRRFEEGAEDAYTRGLIHGTMHLSIGQEASAVGTCMDLRKTDYITSTHRGHGHCIAKGADPKLMFAEFFGKEEGYCRGRGGSMHIADVESGNLGANGIVGGGIPIAVGAALAIRRQKRDDVAVCFFGDGASNEGAFHEALNMAAIWRLPVLFICENNKYGMSVSTERSMAVEHVADRAASYKMPGEIIDGNRIEDVSEAVMRATARARNGEGPTLLECKTYRIRGHSKSDRNRYRTKEEIEEWKARDPIGHFETSLEAFGILNKEEVAAIRAAAEAEIVAAIEYARNGTDPSPTEVTRDVYTQDHDDFGLKQSKVMNVIDSNVERDSREKPVSTFSHPAPGT
jgi:acetoin:2,6-dichlorophenolindophenol oxidoreductase subunit alpha